MLLASLPHCRCFLSTCWCGLSLRTLVAYRFGNKSHAEFVVFDRTMQAVPALAHDAPPFLTVGEPAPRADGSGQFCRNRFVSEHVGERDVLAQVHAAAAEREEVLAGFLTVTG